MGKIYLTEPIYGTCIKIACILSKWTTTISSFKNMQPYAMHTVVHTNDAYPAVYIRMLQVAFDNMLNVNEPNILSSLLSISRNCHRVAQLEEGLSVA